MTDHPYTSDDLRFEAAKQHHMATTDPDFMGIGEQMDGSPIESTFYDAAGQRHENGRVWNQLDAADFGAAQDAIGDLIGKAADVSEWAINIGADRLEPLDSVLSMQTNTGPLVRIHFAVRPDMPEDMCNALVEGLALEIAKYLPPTD